MSGGLFGRPGEGFSATTSANTTNVPHRLQTRIALLLSIPAREAESLLATMGAGAL